MTVDNVSRRKALADAFAAQARSDWRVYQHLAEQRDPGDARYPLFPRCHAWQHLQMATEKIAKAYRIRDTDADPDKLATRHPGFVEFVNAFFSSEAIRAEYKGRDAQRESLRKAAEAVAREIEKLAPAIDKLSTPENAEYPWERSGKVFVPVDYTYPTLDVLRTPGGRSTLNLVARAFEDYETLHIS